MASYKIAFGGTSEQKIGYLNEVLKELNIDAEITPFPIVSGVSEQPLTSEETKSGSLNRAEKAFEQRGDSDFGIGIEVGYEKNKKGDFKIFCWTSIVNNSLRISICSHSFVLPKFHQEILKKDLFLGDYVREYIDNAINPKDKQIGEDIRGRKPFIITAVRNCLLKFQKV